MGAHTTQRRRKFLGPLPMNSKGPKGERELMSNGCGGRLPHPLSLFSTKKLIGGRGGGLITYLLLYCIPGMPTGRYEWLTLL